MGETIIYTSLHQIHMAFFPYRYSNEMATKSTVIGLPILPFNQSKHSDACKYLDHLQNFLVDVHSPKDESSNAGKNNYSTTEKEKLLKGVNVPLCGDLLGRERVTGAKKTRLGCDQQHERFQNIEFPALWHVKQSFLGVSNYKVSNNFSTNGKCMHQ